MNTFRSQLLGCMEAAKLKQIDLAELSGIPPSNISRYFSGAHPNGKGIRKILKAFSDPEHRVMILAAWLYDQLPPEYRDQIEIKTPFCTQSRNDLHSIKEQLRLDTKTQENLLFLLGRFEGSNEIKNILDAMAGAIQSEAERQVDEERAKYKSKKRRIKNTE